MVVRPPPPPPRRRRPGRSPEPDDTSRRLRRLVYEHERDEKPFDPEARYPREVSPHHFAVNPTEEEWARRHLIVPEEDLKVLALWHSGQHSPTYRLLSIGIDDYVSQSMVQDALAELEAIAPPRDRATKKQLEDLNANLFALMMYPDEFSVEESGIETPSEWEFDELYEPGSEAGAFEENARCPVGTEIQTLIFDNDQHTRAQAKAWAKRNKFKYGKVDVTEESWRLRQQEPAAFKRGTFRTIELADGVKAVVGCPR